jgi:hypothetical protein
VTVWQAFNSGETKIIKNKIFKLFINFNSFYTQNL